MCSQMFTQTVIFWKILRTLDANVWFFTGVCSQMFFQIPIQRECLWTLIAKISFLTMVYSQVTLQISIIWEILWHWLHWHDFFFYNLNLVRKPLHNKSPLCDFTWSSYEKAFTHWPQVYGFVPIYVLKCLFKLTFTEKAIGH